MENYFVAFNIKYTVYKVVNLSFADTGYTGCFCNKYIELMRISQTVSEKP